MFKLNSQDQNFLYMRHDSPFTVLLPCPKYPSALCIINTFVQEKYANVRKIA